MIDTRPAGQLAIVANKFHRETTQPAADVSGQPMRDDDRGVGLESAGIPLIGGWSN